eukprot:6189005-Pleurochrysis_carterae.AAC.1
MSPLERMKRGQCGSRAAETPAEAARQACSASAAIAVVVASTLLGKDPAMPCKCQSSGSDCTQALSTYMGYSESP